MMAHKMRWFGAALVAAGLASAASAQTGPEPATPTIHARARHPAHKHRVHMPEGRQITVHKSAKPSWLTLGTQAPVGAENSYVTSTFDQPTAIQGTFSGYRGRERIINQYGVPGVPLIQF